MGEMDSWYLNMYKYIYDIYIYIYDVSKRGKSNLQASAMLTAKQGRGGGS